jgi:amino acid adenylation domain-containing protein
MNLLEVPDMIDGRFPEILPVDYDPFDASEVESTIPDRFDRIVRRCPDGLAVNDGRTAYTYDRLNRHATALAHAILRRIGREPEAVAVLCRHGALHVASLIGVLKAGKFFCSLDSDQPKDRLARLVRHLGACVLLYDPALEELARLVIHSVPGCVGINAAEVADTPQLRTSVSQTPDHLAFVVFTSGSTGDAEGVPMTHRNLLHATMNYTNTMHLRSADRVLQICHLSSAASIAEIFPVLLTGGTLYPFSIKDHGVRRLAEWLVRHRISVCTFVPVMFRLLLANVPEDMVFEHVRLVRLSGDRVLKSDCVLYSRHFPRGCLLRVALGASEVFLFTQYYVHHDSMPCGDVVPAGYPLPGMTVSVVDERLNALPTGHVGEIAVTSRYLSPGYWLNDRLTAERFLDAHRDDGAMTYLTRDVGYLEPDGCLVHTGRKDARTKVYGRMVDLSEIERQLMALEGVRDAVVVRVEDDTPAPFLLGYFVREAGCDVQPQALRARLASRVPLEIDWLSEITHI